MDLKWKISEPEYLSDKICPKLRLAYWEGHRDFAYDFINFVKPESILELGSQYGCSLFAFCQSVKDNHLRTKLCAVDKWAGDVDAVDTGEKVFEIVNDIKNTYFSGLDLSVYPMLFDDAFPLFAGRSFDIIHIDGNHDYQSVKHDFTTWISNLKENGIVLFHDVYSSIESGACDFWKEIKSEYKTYFEFKHSCGLGVLFPKGDYWYQQLQKYHFFDYAYDVYQYRAQYRITDIRFQELKDLYEERYAAIQEQSKMIAERDATIKSQAAMLEERYAAIQEQSKMIAERDATIKSQAAMLEERYAAIQEQSKMIAERDETIQRLKPRYL